MIPSLLLKALPYLAAAAVGAYGAYYLDGVRLAHLQSQYDGYKVQIAQAAVASQKAATDALEAQIRDRNVVEARNAEVESQLESANHDKVAMASSLDFSRRLLAAARASVPASGSHSGTETPDQSKASPTSGTGQDESLAGLVAAATSECTRNADRLDALIAEIKPQL